ncbi:NAAA-beta domain-containing protein [Favolaschia claudopus]|uniref:ceramidase n=1 Tax=Favolaschia claudopus TaxID=2862362 RepID=A0AAW0BXI5_9AGAR
MAPTTRSKTRTTRSTVSQDTTTSTWTNSTRRKDLSSSNTTPTYQVNLSLPPEHRYDEICADYKAFLGGIMPIYDDLLQDFTRRPRIIDFLAKSLLRRVHSSEESKEIHGISKATGVPVHLVVAFNTFLDLFSGCSSGGVRVADAGSAGGPYRNGIVHFRGLDWAMDPLRQLIICVEYIRDGQIVARAITYAGYIGILTGVRAGLSISLNYRVRFASSPASLFAHRLHQALVLLGFRPSISSILRQILLSPSPPPSLASLAETLSSRSTTPCYLIFCTPASVLILEKDLKSAVVKTADDFLAVTNHDTRLEGLTPEEWRAMLQREGGAVHDVVLDSIERKECISHLWKKEGKGLKVKDVVRQLQVQPVQNECTHYSCVMDPSVDGGGLLWVRSYDDPVEMAQEEPVHPLDL